MRRRAGTRTYLLEISPPNKVICIHWANAALKCPYVCLNRPIRRGEGKSMASLTGTNAHLASADRSTRLQVNKVNKAAARRVSEIKISLPSLLSHDDNKIIIIIYINNNYDYYHNCYYSYN